MKSILSRIFYLFGAPLLFLILVFVICARGFGICILLLLFLPLFYPFYGAYWLISLYCKLWKRGVLDKFASIALTAVYYVFELVFIFLLASAFS